MILKYVYIYFEKITSDNYKKIQLQIYYTCIN